VTDQKRKPGPKADRLKVEGDPGEILDRMLSKGEPPLDRREKTKPKPKTRQRK
jgi:hypothetical protein